MSTDALLQPYRLKHLVFRNRLMSTAHEPAYTEDGMPKERYRLYHAEKAKGGIALTMIGGSSVVAPDSPQAFGNILLYKDEVVRWLKELADDVHAHGAAVMIQVTHLGRRTSWSKADWLPVVAPSNVREPAHRAFPKIMEDWDIARVIEAYADSAERVKAAGLDGLELECYGHLIDQFWSPATNKRDDDYGGSLDNRMRFGLEVLSAVRKRVARTSSSECAWSATRIGTAASRARKASRSRDASPPLASSTSSMSSAAISTPRRRSPMSSPAWARAPRPTSTFPAR
jgi:N-methyl-L-proline demethylase